MRSVVIEPEEAARNGAQWRVVTQWQGAGEAQSEALQLVEFKNVPGWEAPSLIVLKNGEFNAELKRAVSAGKLFGGNHSGAGRHDNQLPHNDGVSCRI